MQLSDSVWIAHTARKSLEINYLKRSLKGLPHLFVFYICECRITFNPGKETFVCVVFIYGVHCVHVFLFWLRQMVVNLIYLIF